MPKPYKHPRVNSSWVGNVGKGKSRRTRNLGVPLTEPIEVAQRALDRLLAAEKRDTTPTLSSVLGPADPGLETLFRHYVDHKRIHYSKSRKTFYSARVEKILTGCKFRFASDIDGPTVLQWIAKRQESKGRRFSASTAESYRKDFSFFCNWLIERGYLSKRPFTKRDRFKGGLAHKRRNLTPDEQRSLLTAAERSTVVVDGINGKTRKLIYWTALRTGFRNNELRSLTVACVRRDRLTLDGEFCKNGEPADQPLPPALATSLRAFCRKRSPSEPLFPHWPLGVRLLRPDLKDAGIEYKTEEGCADFHSLRHTFLYGPFRRRG